MSVITFNASDLWIAGVSRFTEANWIMVVDSAFSVRAAIARTYANLVDARF